MRFLNALNVGIAMALMNGAAYAQVNDGCGDGIAVPEPASISLLAVGVAGLLLAKRYPRASRVVSIIAFAAGIALWHYAGTAYACV